MRGQSPLDPASDAAEKIADLWWILFAVSVVVFSIVVALLVVGVVRGRGGGDPDRRESRRGRRLVAIGGFAAPAVVVVALFFASVATLPAVSPSPGKARMTIDVVGRQWFWDVYYLNPAVRTSNEIHVPVGETVELRVRTADVIHSLWVPRLNRKIDMIPGKTSSIMIDAREPGVYRGQCAEFCGLQHAHMAFLVVAQEPAAFRAWLGRQLRPAPTAGAGPFLSSGCSGCHTVAGTPARSRYGPDLTHIASRRTIAAGTLANTPEDLATWISDPQAIKPGTKMPTLGLPSDRVQAIVDYLESLR